MSDSDTTIPEHNAVLAAWSSPTAADRVDALSTWYDETHIPEVRANVPGIVAARRYHLVDPTPSPDALPRLLTLYFVEGDVNAAANALTAVSESGKLTLTDAMDFTGNPPVLQWAESV